MRRNLIKFPKIKKKTKINDLFAADLVMTSKAHMMYLSFFIFRREVENMTYNDPNV